MRILLRSLLVITPAILGLNGALAQPTNDHFANRVAVTGPAVSVTGSNVDATTESGEPVGGGFFSNRGATVWWSWTAPTTGLARLDTFGSDFNTYLGVYTGTNVGALSQVALNDNAPGGNNVSLLTFNAQTGTVYQIQVGGARSFGFPQPPAAMGNIQLHIEMPPSVAITAPTNGALVVAGSNFLVTATASSPNGPIAQVEFYRAGAWLGADDTAPYELVVSNTPPGTNALLAVATDNLGLVSTSAVVNVGVLSVGVTLVLPADGTVLLNNNPLTLRAAVLLFEGTMTNVQFLANGEPIGEVGAEPFRFVWPEPASGLLRLTAVGTDDAGQTHRSAPVWIAIAQPLLALDSVWKYFDIVTNEVPGWQEPSYDDSEWASGPAELGYGDGDEATVISFGPDENNKYITAYFRQTFVADDPSDFTTLVLSLERDDGGVVYLNGQEVFRTDNMPAAPAPITFDTLASGFGSEDTVDTVLLDLADLQPGTNVLAVEIHQQSANSSDLSFNLALLGVPEIIRNQLPEVRFASLVNNAFFFAPADLQLDLTATDADGSVTNITLYIGTDKLLETTNNAVMHTLHDLPPGHYQITVVATDNEGGQTYVSYAIAVYARVQKWVAYNDHYAGPNTHPRATAWNAFGTADGAPGDGGSLRDLNTGNLVPGFLTVLSFGAMGDSVAGAPPAGTPAYDTFNGFVDFGSGGANHAIVLGRESVMFHLFTGLDPNRRYSFRGTAVGGVPDSRNRWTRFTLLGAEDFLPAHSANVLTAAAQPGYLAAHEAAMNTGDNTTGDLVGWDDIMPGSDGSFTVVSTLYDGPAPGNTPPGFYAYAPVAVRLEETGTRPFVEITRPEHYAQFEGFTDLAIAAHATAVDGITNVVFRANEVVIGQDASAPYAFTWNDAPFASHELTAVAYDRGGLRATSEVVSVLILPPPENTNAPTMVSVNPPPGAILTNLTTIAVTFSEVVYGVDAADLLVNGITATAVTGSGSNYVFTVQHSGYGQVWITWAREPGITDFGYPAPLPFDTQGLDSRWSYSLVDRVAPTILAQDPPPGANVSTLTYVTITFSEPVTGVKPSDLLVRNLPATGLLGGGATYTFTFPQPPYGPVTVRWSGANTITDLAPAPNAFSAAGPGTVWTYVMGPTAVLVPTNSFWRIRKGTAEASTPTDAWRQWSFDDRDWDNWIAPFYYGDPYDVVGNPGTWLGDMQGSYAGVFLRKSFVVTNAVGVTNLLFKAQSDDGFIAWINGVEVTRFNGPVGEPAYDTTALSEAPESGSLGAATVIYNLPDPYGYLREGTNVLTVQAFNHHATNDDFVFETQLYAYRYNPALVGPGIIRVAPAAGAVFELTDLTVTFNEPVRGVEAGDLLLNGVPAEAVAGGSSNSVYIFSFPQPAYGQIAVTWASGHGITDFDATPRTFNATGVGSTWQYLLLNPDAPLVTGQTPSASANLLELTEITVTFSKPVTGVQTNDLLINGLAATGMTGDGDTYTWTFPQPAYGNVFITWSMLHAITDTEVPPNPFSAVSPGAAWHYTLLDRKPPIIAAQNPSLGQVVTNFTELTLIFSEPVNGVDATDLLINGVPARDVGGSDAVYTFEFPQPNASQVTISWVPNPNIWDLALPANAFDPSASGASWTYAALDNVPPTLVSLYPIEDTTVGSLSQITVVFDEPVTGVDAADLVVNDLPAHQVEGAEAGPYTFLFPQPEPGLVQVAWAAAHGIQDLTEPPNTFAGQNWAYLLDTNLPPPTITRGPYLQIQTPTSIIVRWRTEEPSDSRVQYGLNPDSRTNVVDDLALTTEHLVTLTNLTPATRYVYAFGATDTRMIADPNYYFSTAPAVGTVRPTRIWYVSDFGFGDSSERAVRDSYFNHVASEKPADVWITGGDNDQRNGTDSGYTEYVFGTNYAYGALMQNLAVWPTIGNHDYSTGQGVNYYAAFSMPTQGEAGGVPSGTEHYYSFDYANIHFLTLDGIDGTLSRTTNTAMIQWLEEDLAANTQPWVIAYWHGPPYTKGSHDSDSTTDTLAWMIQLRENVLPVLEAYGVDLVLCGHSHVHERTWLLHGHYGFSSSFNATNKIDSGDGKVDGDGAYRQTEDGIGTVYISNGVGGQPRTITNVQHPAHLLKIAGILGSLVIDVNGNRLDCKYLNTTGGTEDYFTLIKNASGLPQLIIANSAGMTTVSWPASAEDFDLWQTEGIEQSGGWTPVTEGVQTNGTARVFQFDPASNAPAGFFRLQKR